MGAAAATAMMQLPTGAEPAVLEPPGALGRITGVLGEIFRTALALPEQASDFAVRVDWLHFFQFGGFWIMGVVLFGCVGWFLLRYRRTGEDHGPVRTERITAPLWLEIVVVGTLLGFFVGAWIVGFRQYADAGSRPDDAYEVYVTGKQWTWTFDYPSGARTTGVLYLPQDRPVRLLITSRDVIHSFFVPEFRIKRDAVPGRYNAVTFVPTRPGSRRILCTEFCGTGHSRMWADVEVLAPADFDRWLETGIPPGGPEETDEPAPLRLEEAVPPERASLAERGRQVAASLGCLGCHTVDGSIHLAPTWQDLYGRREPLQSGDTVTVDAGYITESMMRPQAQIVRGFSPIMPSFQGQVDPSQTAAIVEYIRSLSSGGEDGAGGADGANGADGAGGAGADG